MAAFNLGEVNDQELDWVLLRDGGISLYWRLEFLNEDLGWFISRHYQVHSFDAANWKSEGAMHQSLQETLSFPDYYGKNLDALNECLQDDLAVPESGGMVIVLTHFDSFARAISSGASGDYSRGEIVLDCFALAIRYHSLLGRRLLLLLQSDDPMIEFGRLGGVGASWNWREWLNEKRGL